MSIKKIPTQAQDSQVWASKIIVIHANLEHICQNHGFIHLQLDCLYWLVFFFQNIFLVNLAIYTLTVQDKKILDYSTLFLLYTNYSCPLQNMTLQPQTDWIYRLLFP